MLTTSTSAASTSALPSSGASPYLKMTSSSNPPAVYSHIASSAPVHSSTPTTSQYTPVRDRVREQLRDCQSLIRDLFDAQLHLLNSTTPHRISDLPPVHQKSQPVQIMHSLIDRQQTLRGLVDQLLEHQELHRVIEELRHINAIEDDKIAHLGANMRAAESLLQNALDEARPRLAALNRANKRPVDVDQVISYGSKITASLSAPLGWQPSQPLGNHLPPAPTEAMMRSGRLAQLALNDELSSPLLVERPP